MGSGPLSTKDLLQYRYDLRYKKLRKGLQKEKRIFTAVKHAGVAAPPLTFDPAMQHWTLQNIQVHYFIMIES